jgi:hypothetical protein
MPSVLTMTVDHDAATPLWAQLAGILRKQIQAGKLPSGRIIPSESTLMQEHELARGTVRKAIDVLVAEAWSNASRDAALSFASSGAVTVATTRGAVATFPYREGRVVTDARWGSMDDWPEWRFLRDVDRETTPDGRGRPLAIYDWPSGRIRVATMRLNADSQVVRKLGRDLEPDSLLKVEPEVSDRRPERLGPGPFPGAYDDFLCRPRRTTLSASDLMMCGCCVQFTHQRHRGTTLPTRQYPKTSGQFPRSSRTLVGKNARQAAKSV